MKQIISILIMVVLITSCSKIDPYAEEHVFYSNFTPRDYSKDPLASHCWKLKSEQECLEATECAARYIPGIIVETTEGGYEEPPIYKECIAFCKNKKYFVENDNWWCAK